MQDAIDGRYPAADCRLPTADYQVDSNFRRCLLVRNQAAFWISKYMSIALICAKHNLQSAICNLQLH